MRHSSHKPTINEVSLDERRCSLFFESLPSKSSYRIIYHKPLTYNVLSMHALLFYFIIPLILASIGVRALATPATQRM